MLMRKKQKHLDLREFGQAVKTARKSKGWTQEKLATLAECSTRYIMDIENQGQHPSLDTLYLLVTNLGMSVDRYFYCEQSNSEKWDDVNVLLNSLTEGELLVIEGTANGLKKMRKQQE